MNKESAAAKIMKLSKNYLEKKMRLEKSKNPNNTQIRFTRAELEKYLDSEQNFTEGMKTGALNRFLIEDGFKNGVRKVGWGKYVYTTDLGLHDTFKKIQKDLVQQIEEALEEVYNLKMPTHVNEDDLIILSKISKLLELRNHIKNL